MVTPETTNGIDASATRLDQAFRRLEAVTARIGTGYESHKADKEKLNLLLQDSEREIVKMREMVSHVNNRLDHTIATLEALEQ
jgi:predicted  nucleic acid-binding Zn-ribbon protein